MEQWSMCGNLQMLHSICGLSFLREMESQQKDPISPQCANYSNPQQSTAMTRNRTEILRRSENRSVTNFAALLSQSVGGPLKGSKIAIYYGFLGERNGNYLTVLGIQLRRKKVEWGGGITSGNTSFGKKGQIFCILDVKYQDEGEGPYRNRKPRWTTGK
ncbi:hypothetical protein C8J57DRAFT_1229199 [Mycena rebaudengoi]|nr:hypothetical protein C8J57DRAFT_1229199 [Mycena rebaudengoi]